MSEHHQIIFNEFLDPKFVTGQESELLHHFLFRTLFDQEEPLIKRGGKNEFGAF